MKIGYCFREALSFCNNYYPHFVKLKLIQIEKSVVFSQQNKTLKPTKNFYEQIIYTFTEVDQSPHMSIQLLEIFKQKLFVEQYFSQKLSQILYQVWAQAIILLVFYLALLVYILSNYSLQNNIRIISLSSIIFFAGLFLLIYIGRSFKWKL